MGPRCLRNGMIGRRLRRAIRRKLHSQWCKHIYLQNLWHKPLPTVLTFPHRLKQIGFCDSYCVEPRFGSCGKFISTKEIIKWNREQ
jgi:hypothetical protein